MRTPLDTTPATASTDRRHRALKSRVTRRGIGGGAIRQLHGNRVRSIDDPERKAAAACCTSDTRRRRRRRALAELAGQVETAKWAG